MLKLCEHRTVAEDGRIFCQKITAGDNEVTPNVCRNCPFLTINCGHLRFTLRQTAATSIVVRYGNGRTQVWDDEPPRVTFLRAACAARVMPVESPKQCAGCSLRTCTVGQAAVRTAEPQERPATVSGRGKVVAFPAARLAAG